MTPYLDEKCLSNDIAFSEIKKIQRIPFEKSCIHSPSLTLLTENNITRNSKSVISPSNSFSCYSPCSHYGNVCLFNVLMEKKEFYANQKKSDKNTLKHDFVAVLTFIRDFFLFFQAIRVHSLFVELVFLLVEVLCILKQVTHCRSDESCFCQLGCDADFCVFQYLNFSKKKG